MVMQKGMKNLKYDRTIQCVIKEIKNEKTGEYLVQYNNNPVFSAFSEIKYAINDIVYVVIPEGDYNNQKFITGKVASIPTLPEIINASKKSDLFLDLQTLITENNHYNILINGENNFQPINCNNILQGSIKPDNLLISFKACTPGWEPYNMVQGEYGLLIKISGQVKEEDKLIDREEEISFTCKDMLSNPYTYYQVNYSPVQRKLIDISQFETITNIVITGYQDNNFVYVSQYDTFEKYVSDGINNPLQASILDISASLGIAPSSIEDNEVILYTLDDLLYGESASSPSASQSKQRELRLAWMYTDDEGKRTLIESHADKDLKFDIIWELQDEKKSWQEIKDIKSFFYTFVIPDYTYPSYNFRVKLILTTIEATEESAAVTRQYVSNILTFSNAIDVTTLEKALEENNRFSISINTVETEENKIVPRAANAYFYLYDKNGNIFVSDAKKRYCLQLEDTSQAESDDKMEIKWNLPNQDNSMIIPGEQEANSKQFYFTIKPQLNDSYNSNTIKTEVTVNNHTYELFTTLVFKTKTVFGDPYIIKMYMDEECITHFTADSTQLHKVKIEYTLGAITKSFNLTSDFVDGVNENNWHSDGTVTIGDTPIISFTIADTYNNKDIPIRFSVPVVAQNYDISCLNHIEVDKDKNIVFFDETPFQIYKNNLEDLETTYNVTIIADEGEESPPKRYSNYNDFITDLKSNNSLYSKYSLTVTEADGTAIASCAILENEYKYSSTLTNTWEGKPVVQTADNVILQQILATGVRDCQNRYSGVVMGQGENGKDKYGLYGYSKGNKTFGLTIDGAGFIGPEGKGQIQFDGNNALIHNQDGSCWINLNPGAKEHIESSFLYVATDKREINQDISTFITQLPKGKDYFIVHPNYGIFTSGVVFSNGTVESADVAWMNFSEGYGEDTWAGSAHIGLVDNALHFISLDQKINEETTIPLFTVDKRTGNLSLSDSGIISFGEKGKIQSNENYLTISKNFATINIRDEEVEVVCNSTSLLVTSDGIQINSLNVENLKINNTPLDDYILELVK